MLHYFRIFLSAAMFFTTLLSTSTPFLNAPLSVAYAQEEEAEEEEEASYEGAWEQEPAKASKLLYGPEPDQTAAQEEEEEEEE